MSSCFVCGSICLPDYKTIGYEKFIDIVYDFIHENNIDKIYCCFRNDFDYIIKHSSYIRTRFLFADLPSNFVKNTHNTTVFLRFLPH